MQGRSKTARSVGREHNGFMNPQGAPRGLLHLVALWKISGSPCSGYELMQAIDAKTEGAWRPGPGAIYPILKKLSAEGYIKPVTGGRASKGRAVYEITSAGKAKIESAREAFKSSGDRWALMRGIFVDMLEPEDLERFMIDGPTHHFKFVHEILSTSADRFEHEERVYLLRQYNLILEKELRWAEKALAETEDGNRAKAIAAESKSR